MWEHVCGVCVCTFVHIHVENRAQCQVFSLIAVHLILNLCVCTNTCYSTRVKVRGLLLGINFSPTTWVPGFKFRSSVLVASAFTRRAV